MLVMVSEVTTLAKQHLAWRSDCNRVCMLGVWFASARVEHIREALAIWQYVQAGQRGRDRTTSFKSKSVPNNWNTLLRDRQQALHSNSRIQREATHVQCPLLLLCKGIHFEVGGASSQELPATGQNDGDENLYGAEGQLGAGQQPQGTADAVLARLALRTHRLHGSGRVMLKHMCGYSNLNCIMQVCETDRLLGGYANSNNQSRLQPQSFFFSGGGMLRHHAGRRSCSVVMQFPGNHYLHCVRLRAQIQYAGRVHMKRFTLVWQQSQRPLW